MYFLLKTTLFDRKQKIAIPHWQEYLPGMAIFLLGIIDHRTVTFTFWLMPFGAYR